MCKADSQDSGSLCFCFRWLLIWFKREFSFEDILTLWEVQWTGLPCDNFHLLIACSILESQRGELIGSDHDFNTILKHINELTMRLDLQSVLRGAEAIYLQFIQCKELPIKVQRVLGLHVPPFSDEDSPDSQPGEAQRLLSQSQAGASSSNSARAAVYEFRRVLKQAHDLSLPVPSSSCSSSSSFSSSLLTSLD
ncbi:unnamed protein product [Pleuronectes platessa]|uniref:Rab-GAP TBC domain-containing protein n=1 Tax=Pleuronectes platessa TaxID=8262 RepID=A0A9N7VZQ0_PLEPL|nr:unnamed protein product [Pleuronectes platessa]